MMAHSRLLKQLNSRLTASPALRPALDAILTPLAFLAWYAGFQSRSSLITPFCSQNPERCAVGQLNWLDRQGLVRDYDWLSDHLSFWTQDGAGALAVFCALLAGRRSASTSPRTGIHLLLLVQSTMINGAIIEAVRLTVQRPRPFVYLNPVGQGGAFAHYTSFYSGHTSFAALASTCAVLACRDASTHTRRLVTALGLTLTVSTGALRVLGGRHFITDVLFGAVAGIAIAVAVNLLHGRRDHADPTTR